MTIEGDVAQALKTYAPLDSIIGGRVYPNRLPSSTNAPAVVYQRISTVFEQSVGRNIAAEDSRLQLAVWASSDDEATRGVREVVAAVMAMTLHGTRHVHATKVDNEIGDWDETAKLHRRIVDVILVSVEAA